MCGNDKPVCTVCTVQVPVDDLAKKGHPLSSIPYRTMNKAVFPIVRRSLATCATRHVNALSRTVATQRCWLSSTPSSSNDTSLTVPPESRLSKDGVAGRPIDFDTQSKIEGNESQIVIINLEPGQVLRAESGAMMFMEDGVEMNTTTGGGLSSGFSRMLTGQNFFISDYTYTGETTGQVALGTDFPSKIMRVNVEEYGGLVCQQGALLCAAHTIDIQMEFT